MGQNTEFSEPPTFKGDIQDWINKTSRYLRVMHDAVFGLGDSKGSLDDIDNITITSAADPGIADETVEGNAAVINTLVVNLKTTGIVEE